MKKISCYKLTKTKRIFNDTIEGTHTHTQAAKSAIFPSRLSIIHIFPEKFPTSRDKKFGPASQHFATLSPLDKSLLNFCSADGRPLLAITLCKKKAYNLIEKAKRPELLHILYKHHQQWQKSIGKFLAGPFSIILQRVQLCVYRRAANTGKEKNYRNNIFGSV